MKRRAIIAFLVLCATTACSRARRTSTSAAARAKEEPRRTGTASHEAFSRYWYRGEAELTRYELEQARYGEIHRGHAVFIFVTEPFLKTRQVKADNNRDPDAVGVLKLNFTRKFNTGIYPYSLMTSVFTPIDRPGSSRSLKVSFSAQEWCGHTFLQLNLRGNEYETLGRSYFESEGDSRFRIPALLLEDEVWTKIRLDPASLPIGKIKIIPATSFSRLRHRKLGPERAKAILKRDSDTWRYVIDYATIPRRLEIRFRAAFPHEILGWEERVRSGFGAGATTLTTRATRTHSIKNAYWKHHGVKDLPLREKLGLRKRP